MSLFGEEGQTALFRRHHLSPDFGNLGGVSALAEGGYLLVCAVEIDIQIILSPQFASVVFHPFAKVEVVVTDHR